MIAIKTISRKIIFVGFCLLVICTLTQREALAHGGRTDSLGGHYDADNVSGLGVYHFHCGGNDAHLHDDGRCPYGFALPPNSPAASDGVYRPDAIKSPQKNNGLEASGIPDDVAQ